MKLLLHLRLKMKSFLSGLSAKTSRQSFSSMKAMTPKHWEILSGLLSSVSSTEPSILRNTDISLRLEQQVLELKVRKAKAEAEEAEAKLLYAQMLNLPHRTYIPTLSHDGLQWVAVAQFGDGSKLVGRGDCPNAALMDYGSQWLGIKGAP